MKVAGTFQVGPVPVEIACYLDCSGGTIWANEIRIDQLGRWWFKITPGAFSESACVAAEAVDEGITPAARANPFNYPVGSLSRLFAEKVGHR